MGARCRLSCFYRGLSDARAGHGVPEAAAGGGKSGDAGTTKSL